MKPSAQIAGRAVGADIGTISEAGDGSRSFTASGTVSDSGSVLSINAGIKSDSDVENASNIGANSKKG